MQKNEAIITVNTPKEYHNCEMIFSFNYKNENTNFKVDEKQKYKIFTTLKEVETLKAALDVYQEEGFKDAYLLYFEEVNGDAKYPEFTLRFKKAQELAKALNDLANDEDSLVQLSEYCLETPPTYADDFRINKRIEEVKPL